MSIYKVLSVLLEYPTEEMRANLFEIRRHAAASGKLDATRLADLDSFIAYAGSIDLTDLQAEYVQTFDLTPEHSLHLTHHLFGDDKNRGPALIDLTEIYRGHGLVLDGNELPDYLPLILEFAHSVSEEEAFAFLTDAGKVLRALATNLARSRSPWLPLLRIVLALAGQTEPLKVDELPTRTACTADCGGEME